MNSPFGKFSDLLPGFRPSLGLLFLVLGLSPSLSGCGGNLVKETAAETKAQTKAPPAPTSIPDWLGNPERNYYGTGPWQSGPLQIVWQIETGWITGPLHKDPWA